MKPETKSKTVYLFFLLVAILVLIITVQTSRDIRNQTDPQTDTNPIPKIANTSLNGKILRVTENIKITFNIPTSYESFFIEISPRARFIFSLSPSLNQLEIEPVDAWEYDIVYTLKLLKSNQPGSQTIDKDYQFEYKTEPRTSI